MVCGAVRQVVRAGGSVCGLKRLASRKVPRRPRGAKATQDLARVSPIRSDARGALFGIWRPFLGVQPAAERPQQGRSVPPPGGPVHAGQEPRLKPGQLLDQGGGVLGVGKVVQAGAGALAGFQDVRLGHGRMLGADLGEEVAAEERRRLTFEEVAHSQACGRCGVAVQVIR